MLLAGGLLAASTPAADQRQQKEAELDRLRARIGVLKQELGRIRGQRDTLQEELAGVERRVGQSATAVRQVEQELAEQTRKLASLQRERDRLVADLKAQRSALAQQLRTAYMMGRQHYVKMLLNQEDPARFGRVMAYYGYLNRERGERIDLLGRTLAELAEVQRAVSAEAARLEVLRSRRVAERETLEKLRHERKRVLERVRVELQGKGTELAHLEKDEKELERLIAALAQALENLPIKDNPFGRLRGQLHWPTRGPLLTRYNTPRPAGVNWQGVVIGGGEGQPVRAVARGRVAFADWLRGYGLMTIIDHGDGYMSLYGYSQALYKEVGDWVEAGEVVATVGDSGGQERNGLYFEIRHKGRPINPELWCRLAAR